MCSGTPLIIDHFQKNPENCQRYSNLQEGIKELVTNYRLTSVLSCLCKILRRIMYDRFYLF